MPLSSRSNSTQETYSQYKILKIGHVGLSTIWDVLSLNMSSVNHVHINASLLYYKTNIEIMAF